MHVNSAFIGDFGIFLFSSVERMLNFNYRNHHFLFRDNELPEASFVLLQVIILQILTTIFRNWRRQVQTDHTLVKKKLRALVLHTYIHT